MRLTRVDVPRASTLYDDAYAKRYRAHDDRLNESGPFGQLATWLSGVCARFQPPIDVLDLGCGTGRYFWALTGVRELVGLDASRSMLAEARYPFNGERITARSVTLVAADLCTHAFEASRFDLVYSIGVLAEHVPLNESVTRRVVGWLKPGGRFAFTAVHPASPSIPRTAGRRAGEWLVRLAPRATRVRARLLAGGMYADERRVRDLVEPWFDIESLERFESEAHLHCLCVARKKGT